MSSLKLDLNKDCQVFGTVVSSRIANPKVGTRDVYSIEITPHNRGLGLSLGLLFQTMMGPCAINGEEVLDQFVMAQTITFETINKPLCCGAEGSNGEFTKGQHVRVSCRFELSEQMQSTQDSDGCFQHPKLILRFVDTDLEPEANGAEIKEITSTASAEQLAGYDF